MTVPPKSVCHQNVVKVGLKRIDNVLVTVDASGVFHIDASIANLGLVPGTEVTVEIYYRDNGNFAGEFSVVPDYVKAVAFSDVKAKTHGYDLTFEAKIDGFNPQVHSLRMSTFTDFRDPVVYAYDAVTGIIKIEYKSGLNTAIHLKAPITIAVINKINGNEDGKITFVPDTYQLLEFAEVSAANDGTSVHIEGIAEGLDTLVHRARLKVGLKRIDNVLVTVDASGVFHIDASIANLGLVPGTEVTVEIYYRDNGNFAGEFSVVPDYVKAVAFSDLMVKSRH